jgi:4-hydroxybenzoate polyprenyltransferase
MSTRRDWLRLLRAPNLLTVPGDPLAGAALAAWTLNIPLAWAPALLAGVAGVLLYAAGLVNNDLADLAEDRRERAWRPVAAGAISPRAALAAFLLLAVGGVMAAALAGPWAGAWAAALLVAVLLYNMVFKRVPVAGLLVMGACRGMNFLLGAVAVAGPTLWQLWQEGGPEAMGVLLACALGWMLFVAAVTMLAANETRPGARLFARVLPLAILAGWAVALWQLGLVNEAVYLGIPFMLLFLLAGAMAAVVAARLQPDASPAAVQAAVGWLIRDLFFIQAAILAVSPYGILPAGLLVLAWLPTTALAGRFYQS